MSTKERYGTAVWGAICVLDMEALERGSTYWFPASEIASRGGVSVPTARKYLAELVKDGHVARAGTKRMPIYALVQKEF